ncbi:MAG: hypothetical protein ABIH11_05400 [Candidatus Altiarchaeota archaeon]
MKKSIITLLMMVAVLCADSQQDGGVVVLSNQLDMPAASAIGELMEKNNLPYTVVGAGEFDAYRASRHVIILGGHGSPEGVGDVVEGLLTSFERQSLTSDTDSSFLFRKRGVWTEGQTVWILAGHDVDDTILAQRKYSGGIMRALAEYYPGPIVITSHSDGEDVVLDSNSIGFYVTVLNNGTFDFEGFSLAALHRSGLLLDVIPKSYALKSNESKRFLIRLGNMSVRDAGIVTLEYCMRNISMNVTFREVETQSSEGCSMCRRGY